MFFGSSGAIGHPKAVKMQRAEGILCQARKRARSLLAQMRSSHRPFCVFLVVALKKCREQDECKEYKKTPSAVYQRK